MKRFLPFALLVLLGLAFATTAQATCINDWKIHRTGGIKHLKVWDDGKKLDVKYTTYEARYYEKGKPKPTRVEQAWALSPSVDQNCKIGYTEMSGADYFDSIGKSEEMEAIGRFFQISHLVQDKSGKPNIELPLYREFLHLAIWEIMHDGIANFDLFSGNLSLDSKYNSNLAWYKSTQDHYLAIFGLPGYEEHNYDFNVLVRKKGDQGYCNPDFLIFNYENSPPPVPVPAAVWLMGTGIAGLVALKRKNASK